MTLRIEQLAFERNRELLFSDVDFTLQPGEIMQIRGANGCGKSTLLRILAGYIEPPFGHIFWQNQSIHTQRDLYQQQLSYLGHQNGIKPYLTAYENLKLACDLANYPTNQTSLLSILSSMGLGHAAETQAIALSAGQTRRLALARLKHAATRLWILDEPNTALDHAGQTILVNLLKTHTAQGGIAIVATHHELTGIEQTQIWHLSSSLQNSRETA